MTFKIHAGEVSLSGNGSGSISIEIDAGRTFRIGKIAYESTGAFKITAMKNTALGLHYLTGVFYNTMLKEDNGQVFKLTDLVPIELSGATKLVLDITDTSGATNAVRISFIGDEV